MYRTLSPDAIVGTAERLRQRVGERFPESGLSKVALELERVTRDASERSAALERPHLPLRLTGWLLSAGLAAGIIAVFACAPRSASVRNMVEFLQAAESAANLTVLLGAAIFSVATVETRLKRRDALALLGELRALAHVIDMHQLTKDPEALLNASPRTESSPKRTMSPAELGRYLDYCSEMFAVLGKLAALYAQRSQDSVVLEAVDGIEDLTSGLAGKVWQKISLIHPGGAKA